MDHVRALNRILRAAFVAGVVAVHCSCTGARSGEGRIQAAVVVPRSWQQASTTLSTDAARETTALALWWERFEDPVLNELIRAALDSSPNTRTAISRILEYRARRGVETAALYPSIAATLGTGANLSSDSTGTLNHTAESYRASLDASWQVDLFGRQLQLRRAASADLYQTVENYYGVRVSLAADVAVAYVQLCSTEAQLAVVRNSLGTRRETVQLTQWREQAGTGNALDTQQSLSTLEQARASIPSLELTLAQTRNQISLLSGRNPGSVDALLASPRAVPVAPTNLVMGIPAETLRQRPDVRAAERGVEAAFARTTAARRERLPSLTLSGFVGLEALRAGRLFSPESTAASLLGSLAAPVFDAGRIRSRIRIQSELEKQSLLAYESAVLTALSEVENALIAVQRNAERLGILASATDAARQAALLSALQYQAGQVDLFISLESQRSLLSLEQQQVVTRADRAIAYIQLYKALGGGWSSP